MADPEPQDPTQIREDVGDELEELVDQAAQEERERMEAREAEGVDEPSD